MRSELVEARSVFAALSCALVVAVALQVVRSQGLLAISDDDYARVVIAQEFAANPRWDPSATSWLPLPFWVTGLTLRVWGPTLNHARFVMLAFNAACCMLLWAVGRKLGLSRAQSVCLTLASALLPSALWLGAAPIPEFSSAILITVSCLSLLAPVSSRWRVLGACATALACASRYEAWPVALGSAAYNGWDLLRTHKEPGARNWHLVMACALCLAFPCAWMLHGMLHHGEMLFFLERVKNYRSALGQDLPSWLELITGYPLALLVVEPLALVLGLSALALVISQRVRGQTRQGDLPQRPYVARAVSLLALQIGVLVLGEARGGAPTHHPERALLAIWTTTSFLAGYLWCTRSTVATQRYAASACALCLLLAHLFAPWGHRLAASRLRAPEEEVGRALASLSPTATVGLATKDYGYFAIMAAAGAPGRFKIWSRHDPREQQGQAALSTWVEQQPMTFLVAPRGAEVQHTLKGALKATPRHQSEQFVLYTIEH